MPTTVTPQSKELLRSLILKEFHAIDFEFDYIYNKADKLINTANDLGLTDLVEEMNNLKEVA